MNTACPLAARVRSPGRIALFALATWMGLGTWPGASTAHAEPDADLLGRAAGYPVAPSPGRISAPNFQVGSWSALDKVPGLDPRGIDDLMVARDDAMMLAEAAATWSSAIEAGVAHLEALIDGRADGGHAT